MSGNEPVTRSDSSSSPDAFVETVADELFQSAFSRDSGVFDSDLGEGSPNNDGRSAGQSARTLP